MKKHVRTIYAMPFYFYSNDEAIEWFEKNWKSLLKDADVWPEDKGMICEAFLYDENNDDSYDPNRILKTLSGKIPV